jgi:transcriptional regulator with XRE-family HTH domain
VNLVKQLRIQRGWTQTELARYSRVAKRTIQSMEQGKTVRSYNQRKVLKSLGLSYKTNHGWVFGDEKMNKLVLLMDDHTLEKLRDAATPTLARFTKEVADAVDTGQLVLRLTR